MSISFIKKTQRRKYQIINQKYGTIIRKMPVRYMEKNNTILLIIQKIRNKTFASLTNT